MKKIFLILIMAVSCTFAFGQNELKYTPSTQQFLSEHSSEIVLPQIGDKVPMAFNMTSPINVWSDPFVQKYRKRKIASSEIYNGQEMISSFIGVANNDFSGIESLGVVIQSKFDNLAIAMIPVNKIEQLAALENVTKIEVAEILDVYNDRQRSYTQAFDAITNSSAAQALGITSPYTGAGVILGVIDTGIDFQHKAFKDANGNSRIVRAYTLSGTSNLTTYSTASQINGLTYDTNAEDHGTHTSSTAGGSSVIINGSDVTVTNDHANATYGGMAPEANLVLCGLSSLYTTAIGLGIQNICNYADQQGKPCVISLSLGSQNGPHDGTGSIASICQQYAGNNHIIVYAASNEAMRADFFVQAGTSTGGGMYASGTSTSAKPMLANLQKAWTNADGNVQLYASTMHAYARSSNVATALKFHVVDVTTGNVVYSSSAYTTGTTISLTGTTGLAQYFYSSSGNYNEYGDNAAIRISRSTSNNKYYWTIYTPVMISRSYNDSDGDGVYNGQYAFCVSVYPNTAGQSSIIDIWESGQVCWFGNDLTLSSSASNSYNLVKGNDECSVSDNACFPNVISVGAYVTRNSVTSSAGVTTDWSEDYPNIGDHASFSSWQTAGYGPLGTALPTISAPGARIIAGINHYHTASVDDYSYWGDYFKDDLVVNNNGSAYAAMEGTSMATPCVSGIVALWLQACLDAGKTPNPNYIKEVMSATWDTDEWTNGTAPGAHGANTFGTHGKINAIKGIQYILGVTGGPTIVATPNAVSFDENSYVTQTYTKTVNVKGLNLEGNITATLSGNPSFSIDKTTITQSSGNALDDITITWAPTTTGAQTATLTLSSSGADNVVVNISGTAKPAIPEIIADPTTLTFSTEINNTQSLTFDVMSQFLTEDIAVTLNDANGVFSVSANSITKAASEDLATVTVSFNSADEGNYSGSVVLSSAGADPVTISLTAESFDGGRAMDAYLNVAKYATIDDAGWYTGLVNNLYTYTEYEDDEVAWLTLPVYGAFVGARYATNSGTIGSGHPQNWIECALGNSNTYAGVTWTATASATSPFTGSSAYFTSATARALGQNSSTASSQKLISFYVTNTTAVKLYGRGRSGVSAQYPARLQVYECTKNADGTVTASNTAVKDLTNTSTSTSTPYTITADGLDATKIYKVTASNYRGYMYEIAFQTPISVKPELTVNPGALSFYGTIDAPTTLSFNVKGKGLTGNVSLSLNDANGVFSLGSTSISAANAKAGEDVNVTFAPTVEGVYTGSITVSTAGVDPITVPITATATKGHVDVKIGKYGVATFYTDIALEIPYDTNPDLLNVLYATSISAEEDEVRVKRIKQYIPALTGVIVQGNAGTYRFNKATVEVDPIENNILKGTLVDLPVSDVEGTVLVLGAGANGYIGFYQYTGSYLEANKVYIELDDTQVKTLGLGISIEDDFDNATSINDIIGSELKTNDAWYTLQGIRLNGKPESKGIYIHNGKSVLVK